ncbi:NAD(P)H-dependent flavin oxidoreductase [Zobellella maritima]|uniref:NAD(P)H-dependent flavin oxidoreductase n=1 Tax=Zobellella maritima TaxID=2059725 RepID=UPI000E2FFB04|nr:nitronate monooxygenase [Zobellella maritima]
MQRRLCERLGILHPLIQAPMAGVTTPSLVAAVSEAGALGSLAAGYLGGEQIYHACREIQARTSHPFSVNLFVPNKITAEAEDIAAAHRALQPIAQQLALGPLPLPEQPAPGFDEQFSAILEANVPVVSFTFGILSQAEITALKARDTFIIGTATSKDEACQLEAAGVDAIVVQGGEAGGHRGSFSARQAASPQSLLTLLPEVSSQVSLPVIAAGGIMNGRGMAAAMAMGAAAVQLGTAFLFTPEAAINTAYRRALLAARGEDTQLTRVFSGKLARGINNAMMRRLAEAPVAPYPLQHLLTQPLRQAAARQDNEEYLSLWAGEGVAMGRELPVADLVALLIKESHNIAPLDEQDLVDV